MKTLFSIVAAVMLISGCGGGGGGSPSPESAPLEKATDVWEGATCDLEGNECVTTRVVTPGTNFYCRNAHGRVLFGCSVMRRQPATRGTS